MKRVEIYPKRFFEVQLIFARKVAEDIQQCDQSFPYQLLFLKASITLFYQFYSI